MSNQSAHTNGLCQAETVLLLCQTEAAPFFIVLEGKYPQKQSSHARVTFFQSLNHSFLLLEAPLSAAAGHKLTTTTLRYLIRSKKKSVKPLLDPRHSAIAPWPTKCMAALSVSRGNLCSQGGLALDWETPHTGFCFHAGNEATTTVQPVPGSYGCQP